MTVYQRPTWMPIPRKTMTDLTALRRKLPRDLDEMTVAMLNSLVEDAYVEGYNHGALRGQVDAEIEAACGPRTAVEGAAVHVMVGDSTECIADGILKIVSDREPAWVMLPEGALVRTTTGGGDD